MPRIVIFTLLIFVSLFWFQLAQSSGSTDSASIRAIESEVRRVKTSSDGILSELKRQKDANTAIQNEFKWLHNELKGMRKTLSDLEIIANKTQSDSLFIREQVTNLTVTIEQSLPTTTQTPKMTDLKNSTKNNSTSPASTKKFILF